MSDDDIVEVAVRPGVNNKGKGFCHLVVTTVDGRIFMGQLSPDEVRAMALNFIGAAEAAETDGIVFQLLRDRIGCEDYVVAGFINDMREMREGNDG